jgi:hypothetical protein
MSWTDELWQEEHRKTLASDGQHAARPSPGPRVMPGRRWWLAGLAVATAAGTAAALFVAAWPWH